MIARNTSRSGSHSQRTPSPRGVGAIQAEGFAAHMTGATGTSRFNLLFVRALGGAIAVQLDLAVAAECPRAGRARSRGLDVNVQSRRAARSADVRVELIHIARGGIGAEKLPAKEAHRTSAAGRRAVGG